MNIKLVTLAALLALTIGAGAQTGIVTTGVLTPVATPATLSTWTKIDAENYSTPDTVAVVVPANGSVTLRWGSGTTFVQKVFNASTSFAAANAYFGGDPTPGTVKELDVLTTQVAAVSINGKPASGVITNLTVTPSLISVVAGTVIQTTATCTYAGGLVTTCTSSATYTVKSGGIAIYETSGAFLATQAGPAELDVTAGNITVKLGILVVSYPIYFPGGVLNYLPATASFNGGTSASSIVIGGSPVTPATPTAH